MEPTYFFSSHADRSSHDRETVDQFSLHGALPYATLRQQTGSNTSLYNTASGAAPASTVEAQYWQQDGNGSKFPRFVMQPFKRAPITNAGRVAYLGESANVGLLFHDGHGTADFVHYPVPGNIMGRARGKWTDFDDIEISLLHQRGAFLLPPRTLCDELVDAYFKWVAPIVPVINRTRFMRQYHDVENPPPLLLLQTILLAGSRVCTNPQLRDANGSTTPVALAIYNRAKALYNANYEEDRVTIVQALILLGWYWEGTEDAMSNVFCWSRVAIIVGQGAGMHRSMERSQLSIADKKLWKRIWWTLFTRDRSVAVTLDRAMYINTDDCDVEMVCEEDFIEDDGLSSESTGNTVHIQFFLQYIKLCEIMGSVMSQQYSVTSKARGLNKTDLIRSDAALADWLQNCPKEVYWEVPRHNFWSALLHSHYYTTLCLLHRANVLPTIEERTEEISQNIASQAAAMMTTIIKNLSSHNELQYCPAFVVYSLFSALVIHVHQKQSNILSLIQATQDRIRVCMNALNDISRVWLVAKMVHTLVESMLSNKDVWERLPKAPGKRLKKVTRSINQESIKSKGPGNRKYEDMILEFPLNNWPAPRDS